MGLTFCLIPKILKNSCTKEVTWTIFTIFGVLIYISIAITIFIWLLSWVLHRFAQEKRAKFPNFYYKTIKPLAVNTQPVVCLADKGFFSWDLQTQIALLLCVAIDTPSESPFWIWESFNYFKHAVFYYLHNEMSLGRGTFTVVELPQGSKPPTMSKSTKVLPKQHVIMSF